MTVQLPIDHLREIWPRELRDARLGALIHPASVNSKLEHVSRILKQENGRLFRLAALFGPQHGFRGETQDNMIEWRSYEHPSLHIPIYSLYGEHREPTPEMLHGLDALLIDLQDVGARYYTFVWTVFLCMRACEAAGVAVVVLDRPNPINGTTMEGPLLNPEYRSFVGMHPIPVRHGKTIGELATQFQQEAFPNCALTVLPMKNWERSMWFDDTGLPWANPSPNMRNMVAATVYPGVGAIEGTNISVVGGSDTKLEQLGAPWIDGPALAAALNASALPGIRFYPVTFTPAAGSKLGGQACHGVFLMVTDRDRLRPVRVGLHLAATLSRLYGQQFTLESAAYLFGSKSMLEKIRAGEDPSAIAASWAADEAKWRLTRAKYLLY